MTNSDVCILTYSYTKESLKRSTWEKKNTSHLYQHAELKLKMYLQIIPLIHFTFNTGYLILSLPLNIPSVHHFLLPSTFSHFAALNYSIFDNSFMHLSPPASLPFLPLLPMFLFSPLHHVPFSLFLLTASILFLLSCLPLPSQIKESYLGQWL